MKTIWYSVEDDETRFEMKWPDNYDLSDIFDARAMVRDAAEDYWSEHDGWDRRWPLRFYLYSDDTSEAVQAFCVEMELSPNFYPVLELLP